MLNQVNEGVRRAARRLTINHPNSVDVTVWRKAVNRDEPELLGGALVLSPRDEADYEIELEGAGRMMFLGRLDGSDHAAFANLNYSGNEIRAYIEPLIEGEFEAQKHDRVFWHLLENVVEYEIVGVVSPSQFPDSRLSVYVLQPIELSSDNVRV